MFSRAVEAEVALPANSSDRLPRPALPTASGASVPRGAAALCGPPSNFLPEALRFGVCCSGSDGPIRSGPTLRNRFPVFPLPVSCFPVSRFSFLVSRLPSSAFRLSLRLLLSRPQLRPFRNNSGCALRNGPRPASKLGIYTTARPGANPYLCIRKHLPLHPPFRSGQRRAWRSPGRCGAGNPGQSGGAGSRTNAIMGKYFDMLCEDVRFREGLNACMNCGVCTGVCPAAGVF